MNYKRVTKEELEEYLAKNPGANYRVNGQEQKGSYGDEDQGALMKILTSLSRPFRAVPASVAAAISGREDYDNPFLTAREEASFGEDPTKWGTKQAAGLGAYLVPGGSQAASVGGRIVGAAGKGAVSGGLAGFGASEEEDEMMSILKGAGLGALIGGGTQGIGEGIRAVKQGALKGQATNYLAKQRGEAIGLDPNRIAKARGTGVDSATRGEDVIDSFFNSMDELGLPSNTSNKASLSADQALGYYGKNFDDLLTQSNSVTLGADTTKGILQNIKREVGNNPSVLKSPEYNELYTDLLGLGKNYTPAQLNVIREKARGMINWSSSGKLPRSERAARAFFDSLDDTFKATIPESAGTLGKMRDIFTVRPFIQGKAVSADVIPVGTTSTHINIPTLGVNEAVQSGIGRIGQGLQGLGQAGQVGQAGQGSILPLLQQIGIPGVASMGGQAQPMEQGMEQSIGQGMGQMPQGSSDLQAINLLLAEGIMSGQISATEAKAVMDLLGLGGGGQGMPTTDGGRKAMVARDAAVNSLNILGGNRSVSGKTQGIENWTSELFGVANEGTAYRQELETLRSQVFNAMGGTNLTPNEQKQFEKFLPKVTDGPAVAEQKLRALIPMLESLMGASSGASSDMDGLSQLLGY